MRLAGHTYPYRDRPLEHALDEIAGLGLSTVEVWLGHAADTGHVARAVRERGLDVAAVSAGGIYALDTDVPARAFELAEALGASVVVACVAPPVLDDLGKRTPAGITLCVENHWDQPLARSRDRASGRCGRKRAPRVGRRRRAAPGRVRATAPRGRD